MSDNSQMRAAFEKWHLETRGHVNADSKVRAYLQEKDWEVWQAASRAAISEAKLLHSPEVSAFACKCGGKFTDDPQPENKWQTKCNKCGDVLPF